MEHLILVLGVSLICVFALTILLLLISMVRRALFNRKALQALQDIVAHQARIAETLEDMKDRLIKP